MSSEGKSFSGWNPGSFTRHGKSSGHDPGAPPSAGKREVSSEALFLRSAEIEQVEGEARQAGYDAGFAAGRKEGLAGMAPLRDAWIDWAARLPEFETERLKTAVPLILSILETAFRKMLGEDLGRAPVLIALISRMVGEYAVGRTAELLVPAPDYRLVTEQDPEFIREMASRGVRLAIGPELSDHRIELRFPDRLVSFDPEEAATSLRSALSRASLPPDSGLADGAGRVDEEGGP